MVRGEMGLQRPARRPWGSVVVGASSVLAVAMVALVLVAFGDLHPDSRAIEVLSGHHKRGLASRDADRMQELTRLASAADKQARRASKLRESEAGKLVAAPESKVDAEEMLAHEAKEKGQALDQDMKTMRGELKREGKQLRKDNHRCVALPLRFPLPPVPSPFPPPPVVLCSFVLPPPLPVQPSTLLPHALADPSLGTRRAREEERDLRKVKGERRDAMIALHDKEMKVLEARHDVRNAAKDGNVQALRESQTRLTDRKDIARGARAEYDRKEKLQDQVSVVVVPSHHSAPSSSSLRMPKTVFLSLTPFSRQIEARARLLRKRAEDLETRMNRKRATVHNDDLKAREEYAASLAIGTRADYLRDQTSLATARAKYASLAELLNDPSTDHEQVEQTLSKIAANIHSWKQLQTTDKADMQAKARLYKKAKGDMKRKSIALADAPSEKETRPQSLFETFAAAGQHLQSLQQQ